MKATLLVVPLAAFVLTWPQTATAATCKDVKFTVENQHFSGREIQIRKVRFRNPHRNGAIQTENVKNQTCRHGATCTTGGDNLTDAEKVNLHSFQIEFRFREKDGQWSKPFETRPFMPKFRKCLDGKKYGPIVVSDTA